MQKVNIHEAKSTLSKLVAGIEDGGEAVELCRAGKPVAQITALPPKAKPLVAGLLKGQIWISDDFDGFTAAEGALFGLLEGK
ncbi:MAG: type II toxin-antitoxin system prevent-host-death family antitoxin [Proteobacteria bacterium]|nr:type II toxin-antitoxin system prevent-host-death family antitoxin [Pseudomonadota bacterium]